MATNIKPMQPPLQHPMLDEMGKVTLPWSNFFENCYRYQKPCWKDLNVSAASLGRSIGNPPDFVEINSTGVYTPAFNGTTVTEELHGAFELQHDYLELSTMKPHLHWYPTTTGAGNVKWQADYAIVQNSVSMISGSMSAISAATGTAWDKIDVGFDEIDGSSLTITMGAQIHVRLYRDPTDAADTYAADAALATFGLHYQNDLFGSLYETVK